MRTVLIAHRDPEIASCLEADFRRVGYHINIGPCPPRHSHGGDRDLAG
jgi:hypothetical protein